VPTESDLLVLTFLDFMAALEGLASDRNG